MVKSKLEPAPLIGWTAILKGFLSGCLVAGGIMNPYGFIMQAVLFVIGMLIFLDALFPYSAPIFPIETSIFFIIGAVVSYVFAISDLIEMLFVVVLIATLLVYLPRIKKLLGMSS